MKNRTCSWFCWSGSHIMHYKRNIINIMCSLQIEAFYTNLATATFNKSNIDRIGNVIRQQISLTPNKKLFKSESIERISDFH